MHCKAFMDNIFNSLGPLMSFDAEPFSFVKRKGFDQLINHLALHYPLPGKKKNIFGTKHCQIL